MNKLNIKNGVSLGRNARSWKTVFSIFYRGCKLPKSVHIVFLSAKVARKRLKKLMNANIFMILLGL